MAVQKPLTWFGGFEGVVASRGHTLELHLLDDERELLCGTVIEGRRSVTSREANSPHLRWCPRCLALAQNESVPVPDPASLDPTTPQLRKPERAYRAALDRRRVLLERRLEEWDQSRDADRTREELAALKWALLLIDAAADAELVSVLRARGYDV